MKVVVYSFSAQGRAAHIAQSMATGLRKHGIEADVERRWDGQVRGDVAVAYGWIHEPVFTAYRQAGGHFAYFDMGYFNRKPAGDKGGSREGHHRLAVNSWDTADTMRIGCPVDRWKALGIEVQPWRDQMSEPVPRILVAGMSGKAAGTHGFAPGQWEREALAFLREFFPHYPVTLREKPANLDAVEPIVSVLGRHTMVISHHSNVSVDALIAGVPSWAKKGVGKLFSYTQLIDAVGLRGPTIPDDRRLELLSDIAYAQWTPAEMRSGEAWTHIRRIIDAE